MNNVSDIEWSKPDYYDPLYCFKMLALMSELRSSIERREALIRRLTKP